MNKYPEAISYFKKALVLDPENDTYKSNLKIAEQKHKEATSPVSENKLYCPVSSYFLTLYNEATLITTYIQCNTIHTWLFCLSLCATDSCWTGIWHGQFNQQPCLHKHGRSPNIYSMYCVIQAWLFLRHNRGSLLFNKLTICPRDSSHMLPSRLWQVSPDICLN